MVGMSGSSSAFEPNTRLAHTYFLLITPRLRVSHLMCVFCMPSSRSIDMSGFIPFSPGIYFVFYFHIWCIYCLIYFIWCSRIRFLFFLYCHLIDYWNRHLFVWYINGLFAVCFSCIKIRFYSSELTFFVIFILLNLFRYTLYFIIISILIFFIPK